MGVILARRCARHVAAVANGASVRDDEAPELPVGVEGAAQELTIHTVWHALCHDSNVYGEMLLGERLEFGRRT